MIRLPSKNQVIFMGDRLEEKMVNNLLEGGSNHCFIIGQNSSTSLCARIARCLGVHHSGTFIVTAPHAPVAVTDAGLAAMKPHAIDRIVAVGGGSAIGVAKIMALKTGLPIAAMPTTFSGSERTEIWGATRDGHKTTGRNTTVLPDRIFYDIESFKSLSPEVTMLSLVNALAHSIDALFDKDCPQEVRELAHDSARQVFHLLDRPQDDSRDWYAQAIKAASNAGAALNGASMALQHKLAHIIGGRFSLDHARVHCALLTHTLDFNLDGDEEARATLEQLWNTPDPQGALFRIIRQKSLPVSLASLHLDYTSLDEIAKLVLGTPYKNPRPVNTKNILRLLRRAYHGRMPSRFVQRGHSLAASQSLHHGQEFVWSGTPLDSAEHVIICIHGRGANADEMLLNLSKQIKPPSKTCFLAPQAYENSWYPKPFASPPEENQPHLNNALDCVSNLYQMAMNHVSEAQIDVVGFSQGACLITSWLLVSSYRPRQLVALSGAAIPAFLNLDPQHHPETQVYLSASESDPWIPSDLVEQTFKRLTSLGFVVHRHSEPGNAHRIHAADLRRLRKMKSSQTLKYLAGLDHHVESEAAPNSLPRGQNSPRITPRGLYAEQLNGTGFTVHRHRNLRTWLYRLRPSVSQCPFEPWTHPTQQFVGTFEKGISSPQLRRFNPQSVGREPCNFLEGLKTFAGAGDSSMRRGVAIHLYAANTDMAKMALCNYDGDFCVVPELGSLLIQTEMGYIAVAPGEIAVIPKGIHFSVDLLDEAARGFVLELYDGHFELPERGLIGANGLADERHFQRPTAAYEDEDLPFDVIVRNGGKLWRKVLAHSPFDVVAWHGNYAPFKYDLMKFNSLGAVDRDHPDPSILTVLTCPLDQTGRNAVDIAVFKERWDASENTFRPPFFHRNDATEFNAVIRSQKASRWTAGSYSFTPLLAPHGVSAKTYEAEVSDQNNQPVRLADDSLWVQFETAYALKLMPWILSDSTARADYLQEFKFTPAASK